MVVLAGVALITSGLGACSSSDPPTARPYPPGDAVALSRPVDPGASTLPSAARSPLMPAQVHVPSIGINAQVITVGTRSDPDPFLAGKKVASFEVPPDLARVGWWKDGATPGLRGMAVLLGHSQVGGGFAVFNKLGELRKGDTITLEDAAGRTALAFAVTEVVTGISKYDETALQSQLASHAATSALALVTCGGDFVSSTSESDANTVAFASRV